MPQSWILRLRGWDETLHIRMISNPVTRGEAMYVAIPAAIAAAALVIISAYAFSVLHHLNLRMVHHPVGALAAGDDAFVRWCKFRSSRLTPRSPRPDRTRALPLTVARNTGSTR